MKKPSPDEREALGTFLSIRRGRLQPAEMGLPTGKRRTPGLRREEIAKLAGVSVSWYTWLEQGRNISVSAAALERLAAALHLDRAETAYLFALSSRQPPVLSTSDEPSDGLIDLVQTIDPLPAYVRNDRLDILAWNPAVADLFVDYGVLDPSERNTLRLIFLHPPYRTLLRDWEEFARGMLCVFRARRALAADKAPFDRLVEEIRAQSIEFQRWWMEDDVQTFDEGTKRLNHPTRGPIDLTFMALTPDGQPNLSFVTYVVRPAACD